MPPAQTVDQKDQGETGPHDAPLTVENSSFSPGTLSSGPSQQGDMSQTAPLFPDRHDAGREMKKLVKLVHSKNTRLVQQMITQI